ncbi:hypothetical protein B0H13DRAFT_1900204 [Mycena leptocephala]|nr:hypothetical protein B0H13DRAFT_1915640 [Mycena leptocephala]KAJ7862318.1 hypothetical protein B0H13DRAFT_1900204 [Mycena leptocephala]
MRGVISFLHDIRRSPVLSANPDDSVRERARHEGRLKTRTQVAPQSSPCKAWRGRAQMISVARARSPPVPRERGQRPVPREVSAGCDDFNLLDQHRDVVALPRCEKEGLRDWWRVGQRQSYCIDTANRNFVSTARPNFMYIGCILISRLACAPLESRTWHCRIQNLLPNRTHVSSPPPLPIVRAFRQDSTRSVHLLIVCQSRCGAASRTTAEPGIPSDNRTGRTSSVRAIHQKIEKKPALRRKWVFPGAKNQKFAQRLSY